MDVELAIINIILLYWLVGAEHEGELNWAVRVAGRRVRAIINILYRRVVVAGVVAGVVVAAGGAADADRHVDDARTILNYPYNI